VSFSRSSPWYTVLTATFGPAAVALLDREQIDVVLADPGAIHPSRTWLHQLQMAEEAMGRQAQALLKQLEAAAQAPDDLAEATRLVFQQHPQMAIFTSFSGLGELPAARLPAEIGDNSAR
jgi:hypothetical protein